jgi:hypothetical protein
MATVIDLSGNGPAPDSSINTVDSTFAGWRDQLGEINVRGSGANDPAWSQIGATAFWAFTFPGSGALRQFWHSTHIQHDYDPGTKIYPHIHWYPATTGTGNVVWNVSWTAAKGHNQGAMNFAAPTTFQMIQAAPAIQYQHMITECSDAQAISVTGNEPDTVIKMRIWRDPNDALDTYTGDVYVDFFDVHYQTDRFATPNKAPNFYV